MILTNSPAVSARREFIPRHKRRLPLQSRRVSQNSKKAIGNSGKYEGRRLRRKYRWCKGGSRKRNGNISCFPDGDEGTRLPTEKPGCGRFLWKYNGYTRNLRKKSGSLRRICWRVSRIKPLPRAGQLPLHGNVTDPRVTALKIAWEGRTGGVSGFPVVCTPPRFIPFLGFWNGRRASPAQCLTPRRMAKLSSEQWRRAQSLVPGTEWLNPVFRMYAFAKVLPRTSPPRTAIGRNGASNEYERNSGESGRRPGRHSGGSRT